MSSMKSINFLVVFVFLTLAGCAKEPLTGIVTYKEYDKAHWSTELYQRKTESLDTIKTETSFGARGGKVGPMRIKSKFKIWVTDKNKIRTFKTDSLTWCSIKCGQKITYDPDKSQKSKITSQKN